MSDPDIFITLSTFGADSPEPARLLEQSGFTFAINPHGRRLESREVAEMARGAKAVVAGVESYDAATLAALPSLLCISRCGAGIDSIDLAEANRRGIAVLNTPDEPTQAVAELTLAMMLGLLRLVADTTDAMRRGEWIRVTGRLLSGKTVGLVGLGRIGRRVATLVKGFEVKVLACDPRADPAWAAVQGVEVVLLEDLLRRSDIVSLHAAGSGAAPLRIGERELRMMRPGSYLLNLARGSMVDDVAAAAALQSGHLAGAAFDVFPREPYDGPLRCSPRTLLSPHQATLTMETRAAMECRAVVNAIRFLREQAAGA